MNVRRVVNSSLVKRITMFGIIGTLLLIAPEFSKSISPETISAGKASSKMRSILTDDRRYSLDLSDPLMTGITIAAAREVIDPLPLSNVTFDKSFLPVTIAPTFDKTFLPDTIGPGSTSMLRFDIVNPDPVAVSDLAFTDTLPAGMTLASPAFVSNTCAGTVTAPNAGTTVGLIGGMVGASQSCFIVVNVTSSTIGTHMNITGSLTSSSGNSGTASDDLIVDASLPGFTKSFSPSTVSLGGRSTLTFTIDNTANESNVPNLDFTDVLPPGMIVANPANASTTCGTATVPPTLTANPGTTSIILDANGTAGFPAVAAMATCTVVVDVVGNAVGALGNVSGNLQAEFVDVGKASAVLTVTGFASLLTVEKEFTDDPVAPGGTTTLKFTVTNRSRNDAATGITFSDDLEATLTGLATSGALPTDPCGAGSSLAFNMGVLTLNGGSLPAEGICTFSVNLQVPAGATPGAYTNSTSEVSGTVGGAPESGNVASDQLFVVAFPVLTKEFTDDPVGAGGTVTLEFTITNPASSGMTDIAFLDELTDNSSDVGSGAIGNGFLPFPVSVGLPPTPDPPCGAGSALALVLVGTDRQALSLTGGSLAVAGMPGDSCTFSVTVDIPAGFASGEYTNTTEEITATVAAATVTGPPASDDIVIVAAPQLSKEFTDDPVAPGDPVTLEFTLQNTDPDNAASAIAFSDDLGAALSGLTLTSVLTNDCGGTVSGVGTDMFGYSGGSLGADDGMPNTGPDQCVLRVELTTPGSPPGGTFKNTTSDLTATVAGLAVTSPGASDDLVIAGLQFSKAFTGDPAIAGGTATLTFTLDNTTGASDATGISFSDDLAANLPGLTATLPPSPDPPCGAGSSLVGSAGDTFLTFSGGSVPSGTSCSFSVTVTVPVTIPNPGPTPPFTIPTPDGDYPNVTGPLSATIGGTPVTLPPATDELTVQSNLLDIKKEFTDDPVAPGGTVQLKFTLQNLSATETVTDIEFSDDLDAALSGLEATGATTNTCGGMATSPFPAGLFEYAGGTLAPDDGMPDGMDTCMIVLTVDVPAAPLATSPPYVNTTTAPMGKVGALDVFGDPASDELKVQLLTIEKDFTDDPTVAGGAVTLEFTLTNLGNSAVNGLAFSDDLNAALAGLEATTLPPDGTCGPGSKLAGTTFLSFTGGSLAAAGSPGDSCIIPVTVTVPATATAGTFLNTTSNLFDSGLPVADPATALLEIEPPPTFAKTFAPDLIAAGGISTLTLTIDNTGSTVAANSLSFTDNFPAAIVVASTPNASTTCSGGTLLAAAASGSISYSGGSVAAGASCTVSVNVTSSTPGAHLNTSGNLTSSSGNSGTASDTLTVNPQPGFAKSFAPDPIAAGGVSKLTFTIDNTGSTVAASNLSFIDNFPIGVVIANPTNASTTCAGGMGDATPGGTSFSFTGGSAGAGGSCTIEFDVTAASAGTYGNTTGDLTSSLGNSGTASDTLRVNPQPGFAKSFAPDPILPGGVSTLTLTIDNTGSTVAATSLDFTDNFPAAIVVASTPNASTTCSGGTLTAAAGSGSVSYSGGSVALGASCTVSVDVTSSTAGTHTNTTGDLTSSLGNSGTASDTLTVSDTEAPVLSYTPIPSQTTTTNPTLSVTITDNVGVVTATIFFRIDGGVFTAEDCTMSAGTAQNGTWDCTIPGTLVNPSAIAYYVTAEDAVPNTASNPAAGAAAPNLFTIGAGVVPAGTYTNMNLAPGSTFGGDVTIIGVLTLDGIVGSLAAPPKAGGSNLIGGPTLTIGCAGTIVGGGPTNYIIGNLAKQYCAPGTFIYPIGTAADGSLQSFGVPVATPEYSPFTAEVTGVGIGLGTRGALASLTVNVVDDFLPNSAPGQSASRYWNVTETGDITANISFTYLDQDVNGNEAGYQVLRRETAFAGIYPGGTVDGLTNTAMAPGVTDFSAWAAGNLGPTAAAVSIGGRVLTPSGRGVFGARVFLTDSAGNTVMRQTNPFGYYRFYDVAAGETYTLSVTDKVYSFTGASRVLFVDNENLGVDIVATGLNSPIRDRKEDKEP